MGGVVRQVAAGDLEHVVPTTPETPVDLEKPGGQIQEPDRLCDHQQKVQECCEKGENVSWS